MNNKKGKLISFVGETGSGKTETIADMVDNRIYCYNQRVLYLGLVNPFSKYKMSNCRLSVGIFDDVGSHSGLLKNEFSKYIEDGDSFDTVVLDFSSEQERLTREDVIKLRYYANSYNIDLIVSLQGNLSGNIDDLDENSHIYNMSDIVIYPNKGVSGRIDIPKDSSVNISKFIKTL